MEDTEKDMIDILIQLNKMRRNQKQFLESIDKFFLDLNKDNEEREQRERLIP